MQEESFEKKSSSHPKIYETSKRAAPVLLDELLIEQLEQAFHQQTSHFDPHAIEKIASDYDPIDLAYVAHRLPPKERLILYESLPNLAAKAVFMLDTDRNTRSRVLRKISNPEAKQLIETMPSDEVAEVFEEMPKHRFERVIETIDRQKAEQIREIVQHKQHTAGRLMTNEFFAFQSATTIGEAARLIREHPGVELTRWVFVIDQHGVLQGFVPARNMIINARHLPLHQAMQPIVHTVGVDASRESVVDLVERYKIPALPVVDASNHLLGVITDEDVVEAVEDIADETIGTMGGIQEKFSDYQPLLERFLARAPWLFFTLFAGLLNSRVIYLFETHNQGILTFTFFFVPLITGMSGNIGLQCSTVLVRRMALGGLPIGNRGETIRKELVLGIATGCFFGFLCSCLVSFLSATGIHEGAGHPLVAGSIVGSGMTSACIAATLLGILSPPFFAAIGVDPAVASGPIITALNDCLSIFIYFLISGFLSRLFLPG